MEDKKYIWTHSPYERDCERPYHQIVYLRYIDGLTPSQIAKYTCYALSTIRSYMYKYAGLLEEAKTYFQIIKEISIHPTLENPNGYNLHCEDNYFYLIKFYDEYENFLTAKVGTTNRSLSKRLNEHFKSGSPYVKMNANYLVIDKVYKCNGLNEGVEKYLIGLLIKKYPNAHRGNDQFRIDLNWEEWDKVIKDYLYN